MFSSVSGVPPIEMTRPTTRMAGGTPTLRKRSEASSLTIAAKMLASSMAWAPLIPGDLSLRRRRGRHGLLFYPIAGSRGAEKLPDEVLQALAGHRGDRDELLDLPLERR